MAKKVNDQSVPNQLSYYDGAQNQSLPLGLNEGRQTTQAPKNPRAERDRYLTDKRIPRAESIAKRIPYTFGTVGTYLINRGFLRLGASFVAPVGAYMLGRGVLAFIAGCGGTVERVGDPVDDDHDGFISKDYGGDDCDDDNDKINSKASEVCDGEDNNCDGKEDNDIPNVPTYSGPQDTAGVGICQPKIETCRDGEMVVLQEEVTPQDEVCDGVDNNCDGEKDNNVPVRVTYSGSPETKNVGLCRPQIQTCQEGRYSTIQTEIIPQPDNTCDGVDQDCDGEKDEEAPDIVTYSGLPETENVGLCRPRVQACTDGIYSTIQSEITPQPDNICDGVDQDCDVLIDEEAPEIVTFSSSPEAVNLGICRPQIQTCQDGHYSTSQTEIIPQVDNTCDGVDQDCDGQKDEHTPNRFTYSGPANTRGVGQCIDQVEQCISGAMQVVQPQRLPSAEICDGLDNDCIDGIDNGIPNIPTYSGPSTTRGVGPCRDQVQRCVDGAMRVVQTERLPSAEICNGVDDNCANGVDNGIANINTYSGSASTRGVGQCHDEVRQCISGTMQTIQSQRLPATETCNGLDDDCAHGVDNGCAQPVIQSIDTPATGQNPLLGPVSLAWTATDPDSPTLTSTIHVWNGANCLGQQLSQSPYTTSASVLTISGLATRQDYSYTISLSDGLSAPVISACQTLTTTDTGLVGWWRMDSASQGQIDDASINDSKLSLYPDANTGPTFQSSGVNGQAISFDGVNDFMVTSTSSTALNTVFTDRNQNYTISFWINPDSASSNHQYLLSKKNDLSPYGWAIYRPQGDNRFHFWTSNSCGHIVAAPITNFNVWNHLTLVRRGDNFYFYLNGQLVWTDSCTQANLTNTYPLTFGCDRFGGTTTCKPGTYYKGQIDEVAVFDRALSEDEIRQ